MSSRLGEMLIKESLITPEQLRQALDHQKKQGGRLGTALIKLRLRQGRRYHQRPFPPVRRSLHQFEVLRRGCRP